MAKILDILINALFPNHIKCLVCNHDLKELNYYDLCPKCFNTIAFNNGKICATCGKNIWGDGRLCSNCKSGIRYFKKIRAPLLYKQPLKNLIWQFKYNGRKYLTKTFSKIMVLEYATSVLRAEVVLPVPMSKERQKLRGYNHSELLAEEFCKLTNLTFDNNTLIRAIDTEQQAKMTKSQREQNLQNAFKIFDNTNIKGKIILLIDDVVTTGTTMDVCAKTLLDSGAKEVFGLALAHAPSRKILLFNKNNKINIAKSFEKNKKMIYNVGHSNL